uniref:Uncharacterized protein n=1 Tax=Phytophthora ramorum TaxID=164328 RepID=H3HBS3_PHYRM
MEAVRKRPQRAKSAKHKPKQEEKLSLSDDEETAALQAAIAELDAIQTPDTTDKEIQRNEEDLLALLQTSEGAGEQELLVAEGAGSQPPNNPNGDGGKSEEKEIQAAEQEEKPTDVAEDEDAGRSDVVTGAEQETKVATPLIPDGVSAPSAPAFEEEHLSSASYEQLLKKKHIRVKLEPFVNYEMNLMRAEASQKRQEMKMRHIETNKGELYARIERYLFSEYILHNAASTMDEYKQKIDVLVKKVWTLEKKRISSSKRCGDNVEIEQQMEFQTAKLETLQLEKLKAHLDKLRQLRTVEASMHTFDRAIAYFHVEQYLNSVLQEPTLVAFLNKTSLSCGGVRGIDDLDLIPESANFYEALPQGSSLASSVDHLKYCLDVLIFFEKKVTLGEEGVFGRVPQSFYRAQLEVQAWSGRSSAMLAGA